MPDNFFRSFTVTSAAIPGVPSATTSGIVGGVIQSGSALKKGSSVLSENRSQRDSLLRSLKALFDDQPGLDHSVLDTYIPELNDGLNATNDGVAFIIGKSLLVLPSIIGHILQVPIDSATVVKHIVKGLSHFDVKRNDVPDALKKASVFDEKVQASSVSVSSVGGAFCRRSDAIVRDIGKEIKVDGNSHAGTHARTAGSTSAGGTIATTATIPLVVAFIADVIGQVIRESGGISHFSANESASRPDEKNVYVASSGVAKATKESDSHASGLQSHDLEAALSDMRPVANLLSHQSVSSPSFTALVRLISLSAFVESSRVFNKTGIATTEGQIQKALAAATAQGPSAGVDRMNSLHSNLSSLSNIMRLCAEHLGGSAAVKTTAQTSEFISSRSISVVLSNVSELAKALRELICPQHAADNASCTDVNSTVDSANPQILEQSAATIKAVLDRVEQENGQHIIPKLNEDMASQINTSARTVLTSTLTTHSIFIQPSVLLSKGSKASVDTKDAQQNEALMATLPTMTQALNTIQASTRNFMDEMEKDMKPDASKDNGSLLSTHRSVGTQTATVLWASSAILLLCDEMLTICRSLTLIDTKRLHAASEKASAVPTRDESAQATEQMSWDSHSGERISAVQSISALRLTLSHTGISLMRIAFALHAALKNNMNTEQQHLAMHTLQRSLLDSCAHATQSLAEGLLASTGSASAFPVFSIGSADWSRQVVHSSDAHLHPAQTHGSENSCASSSKSYQSTGFSTDLVAGTVTNLIKILLKGSSIGMDTTSKLMRILEILSVHRDSHIALQLETNLSSNPNGLTNNVLMEPSVGTGAGTCAILINVLDALQTFDRSSGTRSTLSAEDRIKEWVDQKIESIAVLKDDEEEHENKKGLKEFYKIIIRLLSPNQEEEQAAAVYDSLIKRLDFCSISISKYHSAFGAYNNKPPRAELRFVAGFANDDDAQGVLRHFIDQAKGNYSLLKSLHDALPEDERSKKAQGVYDDVFQEVFQHYKQVKMQDASQHASRRRIPTRDRFIDDIGLKKIEPTQDVVSGSVDESDSQSLSSSPS